MLRAKTVHDQILPVLRYAHENARRGIPVAAACQLAIHRRQKELGVSYATLEDGCRRRLGLEHIGAFHRLVEGWVHGGSTELRDLLMRSAHPSAHPAILQFFAEIRQTPSALPAAEAPRPAVSRVPEESTKDRSGITIGQLDPDVLIALAERARASRRSIEDEIRAILARAARSGRTDLATWAAGLRSRLRDRYAGDVTADIRSDRER